MKTENVGCRPDDLRTWKLKASESFLSCSSQCGLLQYSIGRARGSRHRNLTWAPSLMQRGTQRCGFYVMFRNKHLRSVETCRPDLLSPMGKCWHHHHLPNVEVVQNWVTWHWNPFLHSLPHPHLVSTSSLCFLYILRGLREHEFPQVAFGYSSSSAQASISWNLPGRFAFQGYSLMLHGQIRH
jgi:hypothetical protein